MKVDDILIYSVVIPAYNEEESIAEVVDQVRNVMTKIKRSYEIIVVNDASEDRTLKILKKIKGISIVNHEINKGYGASLKDGIRKSKGEWIIITDSDGTYPVKDIPKLIKAADSFDMVVGARTSKDAKIPLFRRPAKWVLKRVSNYITNYDIIDLNSGLRVFKKDLALKFWGLYPDGFSFTSTITVAAICNGYTVKYIPIKYFKRSGKSSIQAKHFFDYIKLLSKIALYFRPMKIFLPASILLFLLGVARGIRDFLVTNSLGELAVIFVLTSIQVLFFGFIAELIIKKSEIIEMKK